MKCLFMLFVSFSIYGQTIGHGTGSIGFGSGSISSIVASSPSETPQTVSSLDERIWIYVDEPASTARTLTHITSGIPLPEGTQDTLWSLWDSTSQIPCQIMSIGDRNPVLLLDFQVTVGSGGQKWFSLIEQSNTASKTDSILRTGNNIVAGQYQWSIGSDGTIDTVWYDSGNNGFVIGDTLCTGGSITVYDNSTSSTYSAGSLDTTSWEYDGKMRSVFYGVGTLTNFGDTEVFFYIRHTFYAAKSYIDTEFGIINSQADSIRDIKIQNARFIVGSGSDTTVTADYEDWIFTSYRNNVTFNIVPATHYANNSTNNGFVIPDWSMWYKTIRMDFESGLSNSDRTTRTTDAQSPLFATTRGWWYSDANAFAVENMGSLENEIAMNNLAGWSYPALPSDVHDWDYIINIDNSLDTHNDPEGDESWNNLMMFLRIGQENGRGYFDRARGWMIYNKQYYSMRTYGFNYDWDSADEESALTRNEISISKTSADNTFLSEFDGTQVDARDWSADHFWNWGLVDWYLLTGDRGALHAAMDLSEISEAIYNWRNNGDDILYYNLRQIGRHLWGVVHLYEATGAARWLTNAQRIRDLIIADTGGWHTDTDSLGLHYIDSWVGTASFQANVLNKGLYKWYKMTGDTDSVVETRLIKEGKWWALNGLDATQRFTGDDVDTSGSHSSTQWRSYTWQACDIMATAYLLGAGDWVLDSAFVFWDRGSRSSNGGTWPSYDGGNAEFANSYYSDVLFPAGGYLQNVTMLFHEKRLPNIPLNTWYQVANTLLSDHLSDPNPSDPGTDGWPDGLFSYSGGAQINTDRRGLILFGGGHNNYYGNEIEFFNIDTYEWERLFDNNPDLSSDPGCEEIRSGNPPSRHSYDGIEVMNRHNKLIAIGGSCACGNGSRLASVWIYDFHKETWSRKSNYAGKSNLDGPRLGLTGAYAESLNVHLSCASNYDLYEYSISDDSYTDLGNDIYTSEGSSVSDYDPVNQQLVSTGDDQTFRFTWVSGSSWTVADISVSGSFPPEASSGSSYSPGFFWSPLDSLFYCYDGGTTIYTLDPSDWTASTITVAAGNSVTPPSSPWSIYGKFFDIPALPGILGFCENYDSDIYLYRYKNE